MRLLLDSHTLIWAVDEPTRLSTAAATALRDPNNDLLLSAASIWEIAIKAGLRRLHLSLPYRQWMNQAVATLGWGVLPITVDYADVQAGLPQHHGDPFDRLLVAQALTEKIAIVSADVLLDRYGVTRLW
ncbi:MAG TPA: type II toxin-antitoxin system VapC family toxin [Gemmataceae bacterium]|nr:type II toxin-antitoxin system VapC family toxin [Gemmataceae bacterium]